MLVTEAAPWPSLIQRAGRCNRSGLLNADAELWWLPPPDPFPYQQEDIDATARELGRLEGERLTTEDLTARDVPRSRRPGHGDPSRRPRRPLRHLARPAATPSAAVDRYLRDAGEPEVELAWATWTAGPPMVPPTRRSRYPAPEYRCRVPASAAPCHSRRARTVWRFDQARVAVAAVHRPASVCRALRTPSLLLPTAADGGYDQQALVDRPGGAGAGARLPGAADHRGVLTARRGPRLPAVPAGLAFVLVIAALPGLPASHGPGSRSTEHSEQVRDQAAALLAVLAPALPPGAARATVLAGDLHDTGKAHPVWQDALCALADRGRPRRWSRQAARGPSRAPPAASSSPAAFTSAMSSRCCC